MMSHLCLFVDSGATGDRIVKLPNCTIEMSDWIAFADIVDCSTGKTIGKYASKEYSDTVRYEAGGGNEIIEYKGIKLCIRYAVKM